MSSPGGREVGRVSIRVVPDTSGFRRDLKRAVDEAEAGLKVEIPVEFDVDTAGLRAKLESIKARVTIPVDFDLDLARLRAQLEALDSSRVTIPVEIGDGSEIERLQARLAALDSKDVRISVELSGVAEATAQIEYLISLVSLLDGREIDIQVDVDAAAAIAQLGTLNAAMAGTTANAAVMGATSRSAFGGMASAALLAVGALVILPALAAGIAVAGAAITAAWGAAATAVAALPAAIALIGAPLGLLLLDFDSLKETVGKLTPAFQEFRKQASEAFAKGLAPALETFATKVLPKVQAGVTGIATTMGQLAQQASNWLATTQGTQLLNQVLTNVDTTLKSMSVGLGDIGQSFLLLAAQATSFDVLRAAVNEFGASFKSNVVDLVNSGTLDTAMRGLRDMLVELGQGFSDLVHNGIELFAAAAPGVNKFLDSLSGFFNRFDWNSLGTSVGGVFAGLATALDNVPTDTFRKIEDGFKKLSDTFNSPSFQKGLDDLIASLPDAISLANDLATAFGPVGTEISDFITDVKDISDTLKDAAQKADDFGRSIDEALGLPTTDEVPEEWKSPLQKLIESFLEPTDEDKKKAQEAGKELGSAWERGLNEINPQFNMGSVGDDGGSLLDWLGFDSDDVDLDIPDDLLKPIEDAFDDLDLAEDIGTAIEDAAQRARDDVSKVLAPAFQESLAGLAPTITAGLQAGFLQPLTGGLALLNQLFTFNLDLLKTNLTNAFLQWSQIATLGMQQFTLAITNGFALATLAVTTGMQQITLAITNGFAVAVPAVTVGMQQITTAVQTGFTLIVAAVQQGMTQVTASLQTNWATAVSVTAASMTAMTAAVRSGMDQIRAAVQAGMQQSAAAVQQGVQQMVSALQSGMSQAVSVVRSGVSQMVSTLNSARGQFFSAGANMGQALADGLNSKVGAVQAAAARLAAAAAAATRAAAAIRSPSRVFIALGEYMGEGLAIGMNRSETDVERAARSLANTVIGSVSSVQDALAGDAWAADFNARVNSELAQYDKPTPEAASGKQVVIQTTINNPLPETGSDSVAKTTRRQAAMGMFG